MLHISVSFIITTYQILNLKNKNLLVDRDLLDDVTQKLEFYKFYMRRF